MPVKIYTTKFQMQEKKLMAVARGLWLFVCGVSGQLETETRIMPVDNRINGLNFSASHRKRAAIMSMHYNRRPWALSTFEE
jgi:hypothetical protein